MKRKTIKKISYGIGAGAAIGIGTILLLVLCYGISWIITCGVIKLITMCFGWSFKWAIATGIWLIICIARTIFSNHTTVNK